MRKVKPLPCLSSLLLTVATWRCRPGPSGHRPTRTAAAIASPPIHRRPRSDEMCHHTSAAKPVETICGPFASLKAAVVHVFMTAIAQ
jgi:hypothetical protein